MRQHFFPERRQLFAPRPLPQGDRDHSQLRVMHPEYWVQLAELLAQLARENLGLRLRLRMLNAAAQQRSAAARQADATGREHPPSAAP